MASSSSSLQQTSNANANNPNSKLAGSASNLNSKRDVQFTRHPGSSAPAPPAEVANTIGTGTGTRIRTGTSSLLPHTQGHTQPNSHHSHHHNARSVTNNINAGVVANIPVSLAAPTPPPPSSTSSPVPTIPVAVASNPNAPYYYRPYTLFPSHPHSHSHSHSHHGPPPPHPPAPPAPPRSNRTSTVGIISNQEGHSRSGTDSLSSFLPYATSASASVQQDINNDGRGNKSTSCPMRPHRTSTSTSPPLRGISSFSASPAISPSTASVSSSAISPLNTATSNPSPRTYQPPPSSSSSFFHTSLAPADMQSRPQLIPTFAYYRTQTNYDKQHNSALRGIPSSSSFNAGAGNGNEDDNDDDDDDDANALDDYGGDVSAMGTYHSDMPMDLHIDPSIIPSNIVPPPISSTPSSPPNPNYMLTGTEKKPNHEYYPSPHHQARFRELMSSTSGTHLPDPPISLNSLVDSEPGKKPAYPLPTIIRCAILGSPQERLTLSELYLAMERRFSYYTIGDGKSWRNSVRHNLSLNNLFEKVARPITEPGKGCYWVVAHDKPPGNKRERKRNKKPGKKALAAMERENARVAAQAQAQAAGTSFAGVSGINRQTDDEDEGLEGDDAGEDDEDEEDEDQRIVVTAAGNGIRASTSTTSSHGSARRRRTAAAAGSSTSTSTATTASLSPYSPLETATTTTVRRPFNPYSRGTVAPNEGSYAAVTGVMPLMGSSSAAAAAAGFGVGPYGGRGIAANSISSDGYNTMYGNAGVGPSVNLMMGRPSRQSHGVNQDLGSMMMMINNNNLPQPAVTSMSHRNMNSSPESGVSFNQATPTQSSQSSSQQHRWGTSSAASTPFSNSASASPSPAGLGRPQPLSAQSSFGSVNVGFSIPESVAGSGSLKPETNTPASRRVPVENQISLHRTTRQNSARRSNAVTPSPQAVTTTDVPSGLLFPQPGFNSQSFPGMTTSSATTAISSSNSNRPRDTFNALAAQIASEFQISSNTSAARSSQKRPQPQNQQPLRPRTIRRPINNYTRRSRAVDAENDGESQSGESGEEDEEDEEDEEESDDEDEEGEYVPSGSSKRRQRRK